MRTRTLICSLFATFLASATPAFAQLPRCGLDNNGAHTAKVDYLQVHLSNIAKWCVDSTFWPANAVAISQFYKYYDSVVSKLTSLFGVQIPLPIVVEVTTRTGGACACGPKFGARDSVVVTGDAFSNVVVDAASRRIPSFWGYLLTLHETINVVTAHVGGGNWPVDWWADHRSPFPNMLDEHVMREIGEETNNEALENGAILQHQQFDTGGPSYDPEVVMFDNFFNRYGGFAVFRRFFRLVDEDNIHWPGNNPSQLRSEYVIAYLSLAFGTSSELTPTFAAAGVGSLDKSTAPYVLDGVAVRAVANAHCSIHAARPNSTLQLMQLQQGNYQGAVASGGIEQLCPSECTWSQSRCVAKW